jgi:hypothetical protein
MKNKRKWVFLSIIVGFIVFCIIWWYLPTITTTTITEEEAINISKSLLNEWEKSTIENYDNPQIEVVVYEEEPRWFKRFDDSVVIANKKMYKITYYTFMDGFGGPIVIFIDMKNGEMCGWKIRC